MLCPSPETGSRLQADPPGDVHIFCQPSWGVSTLGMAMRMREYAVHEDYAHIRGYADADENLIHITHI